MIFSNPFSHENLDSELIHNQNDPLIKLSKYLKATNHCDNEENDKTTENQDETINSSLYKILNTIESKEFTVNEAINLVFGNSLLIEDNQIYSPPKLFDNYIPRKVIGNSQSINCKKSTFQQEQINETFKLGDVDEKTASAALKGFMPFNEDPEKQDRYVKYLRYCKQKSNDDSNTDLLIKTSSFYSDEREREEFIMSAQIFKPSSSLISARFESSSKFVQPIKTFKAGLSKVERDAPVLIPEKTSFNFEKPVALKSQSPHRTTSIWIPAGLLCKRFNITSPENAFASEIEPKKVKPVLADESVEQLINSIMKDSKERVNFKSSLQIENEIKETESVASMPSEDLFNEIFGNDQQEKVNRPKAIDYFGDT